MSSSPATTDRLAGWEFVPATVEYPQCPDEVAKLVGEANRNSKTVVPIGHATALAYLGRPARCDLGLGLDRLSGLVELNPGDLTVTALAGTACDRLIELAAGENLWLPGAAPVAGTIGGLLASGQTSVTGGEPNGTMRERVLGMQVAGADGTLTRSGGRVVKNVAGYDLHRLHPGTGGAFGVITEVTLRLEPIPEARAGVHLQCGDSTSLGEAWQWLRRDGPDVDVLFVPFAGVAPSGMDARVFGDREVVEAGIEALMTGWRRWGETTATTGDDLPTTEPHWSQSQRELAFSIRALPSSVFGIVHTLTGWLDELGLEPALTAYPNLGEIKLAVGGDSGQMEHLWQRIAGAAASGNLTYRVENQPPGPAAEIPLWSGQPALLRLLSRLKAAFDPEGTLRPGAYSITELEEAAKFFEAGGKA